MSVMQSRNATHAASHRLLDVVVHAVRAEALDVLSVDLRAVGGAVLPSFTAGSHIDVEVPVPGSVSVLLRQYSLSNDSSETHRYVIGVGRDPLSRGGSVALHDRLRAGDVLRIGTPRNNFPLVEDAEHTVLIAGGIGITPMLAMAHRLNAIDADWTLYYCVRTPARAAFVEELIALTPARGQGKLVTVFDGLLGVARLDLAQVVEQSPTGTHFYCCGPVPMLKAFEHATQACDDSRVHLEWFAAPTESPVPMSQATRVDNSFVVKLNRSNRQYTILPEESILSVLLDNGVDIDYSCREGLCGTCETRVLAGTPLHLDPLLAGKKDPPLNKIMVCVSRCAGSELTLDL